MNVTQRQVTIGLFSIMTIGTLLLLIVELVLGTDTITLVGTIGGGMIFAVLLLAYWRGWEYARPIAIVLTTLLVIFTPQEPYVTRQLSLSIFIPPILALIMMRPIWVIGSAAVILIGYAIRTQGIGVYTDPLTIVLYFMIIGGMILARLVTDTAHRSVQEHVHRAEGARAHAERQAQELLEANELMTEQLDQQGQLLELVTTLETPVVPLAEGMLLAPIVGHIDARRAEMLTTRLLQEASAQRARLVVLDIAGVSMVDTAVAKALLDTVQALRLLGCEVTLSGISANVAMALIHLGVNLEDVRTVRSPQEALAQYLGGAARPPRHNQSTSFEGPSQISHQNNGHGMNN